MLERMEVIVKGKKSQWGGGGGGGGSGYMRTEK